MYLKHNMSRTPEHRAWQQMKGRCTNPNRSRSDRYVGRGISVCQRWIHSFENFFADMGPRPSPKHSLDRINNDGNYTPENCKWSTQKEQQNNTSRNRLITFQGQTKSESEWARHIGIRHGTLLQRLRYGWSLEKALTTPRLKPNSTRYIIITFQGRTMSLVEWADHLGFKRKTLQCRLKRGWSPERTLTTPV